MTDVLQRQDCEVPGRDDDVVADRGEHPDAVSEAQPRAPVVDLGEQLGPVEQQRGHVLSGGADIEVTTEAHGSRPLRPRAHRTEEIHPREHPHRPLVTALTGCPDRRTTLRVPSIDGFDLPVVPAETECHGQRLIVVVHGHPECAALHQTPGHAQYVRLRRRLLEQGQHGQQAGLPSGVRTEHQCQGREVHCDRLRAVGP